MNHDKLYFPIHMMRIHIFGYNESPIVIRFCSLLRQIVAINHLSVEEYARPVAHTVQPFYV